MLMEKEKSNFEEAIEDCKEEIKKCKEEVAELKECIDSIELNFYEERIDKNIVKFLNFHLGSVEDLIAVRECEKSGYESALLKSLPRIEG